MFRNNNEQRDELIDEIVGDFESKSGEWTWQMVADEVYRCLGIVMTKDACRKAFNRYIIRKDSEVEPFVLDSEYESIKLDKPKHKQVEPISIERKQDGTLISERKVILSETDMKDDRCVLLAHGFDPDKYDVISIKNKLSVWDNGNKEGTELQSYQSSLTVKPKQEKKECDLADVLNAVSKINSGFLKRDFKIIETKNEDKLCLEVTWPDLHIGSLSWSGQVGQNNDYKIAFGSIKRVCSQIVELLKTGKYEKIVNAFLGDGFHVDTNELTTAGRTQVDTDSRPEKMILMGEEMFMYIIDQTCILEDCENIWVGGNHSKLIEFAVFSMLPFVYRENKHIKFDVTPKDRKIMVYGKVLVGLLHGDEIEKSERDVWLQRDFKKEWSDSEYAEIHCGHFHQEQLFKEKGGIVQRTNPTLKIQDKYEYDHGWYSNKVILAYSWNKETGLQEVFYLR